jgi:hypothetical protein
MNGDDVDGDGTVCGSGGTKTGPVGSLCFDVGMEESILFDNVSVGALQWRKS